MKRLIRTTEILNVATFAKRFKNKNFDTVESVKIIPPTLGSRHFGKIEVRYKYSNQYNLKCYGK